jgi:hypothetical protein
MQLTNLETQIVIMAALYVNEEGMTEDELTEMVEYIESIKSQLIDIDTPAKKTDLLS